MGVGARERRERRGWAGSWRGGLVEAGEEGEERMEGERLGSTAKAKCGRGRRYERVADRRNCRPRPCHGVRKGCGCGALGCAVVGLAAHQPVSPRCASTIVASASEEEAATLIEFHQYANTVFS